MGTIEEPPPTGQETWSSIKKRDPIASTDSNRDKGEEPLASRLAEEDRQEC